MATKINYTPRKKKSFVYFGPSDKLQTVISHRRARRAAKKLDRFTENLLGFTIHVTNMKKSLNTTSKRAV